MSINTSQTPKTFSQSRKQSIVVQQHQLSTSGVLTSLTPKKDVTKTKKKPVIVLPLSSKVSPYKGTPSTEQHNSDSKRIYKESMLSEYALYPKKKSQDYQPDNIAQSHFIPKNYDKDESLGLRYVMSNSSELSSGQVGKDMNLKFQPFLIPAKQPIGFSPIGIGALQEDFKQPRKKIQMIKRQESNEPIQNYLPVNKDPISENKADFRISHYLRVKSYTTEHSPHHSDASRSNSPNNKGSIASTRVTTERNATTRRSKPNEVGSVLEFKTPRDKTEVSALNSCFKMLDLCNKDILDEVCKKGKSVDNSMVVSDTARMRSQMEIKKLKEKIKLIPLYDCKLTSIVNKNHLNLHHKPNLKVYGDMVKNPYLTPQTKPETAYFDEYSHLYSLPPLQISLRANEKMKLSKLVSFEQK